MGLTVAKVASNDSLDTLKRLTELADAVMEAAQLLQVSAVAAHGGLAVADEPSRSELCEALFTDLLTARALSEHEIAQRAAALGCDLSLGAVVLCVELRVQRPGFVTALIAEGCEDALVHTREGLDPWRIYGILPAVGTCIAGSVGAIRQLTQRLSQYGLVGVSSYQAHPNDLGRALREAELLLEVIRHSDDTIADEVGSGTYRLLLRMLAAHPEDAREFYDSTVGPMVAYDANNGTELVSTLRTYLDCDCNMNLTATAVFAHRHTIASRLDRIHQLTGLDPNHHEGRERLGLGLKLYRLLAPQLGGRGASPA